MQLLQKKWCMVVICDALSPLKFSTNKAKFCNFQADQLINYFGKNRPTVCNAGKVQEWSEAPVKYVCFW